MVVMEIKLRTGVAGGYPDRAVKPGWADGRQLPICPSAHLFVCPAYFKNSNSRYPGIGHSSAEICCCISSP